MKKKIVIILGLAFIMVLFASFIWPTMYTKEKLSIGVFGTQTIRTNRFTDKKEVYGNGKWQPILIQPNGDVSFPEGVTITVH